MSSRRRLLTVCGLALLLAALYVVPRAVALKGVSMTSHIRFMDMLYHLNKLDVMNKRHTLSEAQRKDDYFAEFPRPADPFPFMRWPKGMLHLASLWVGTFGPQSIWTTQLTNLLFTVVLVLGVLLLGRTMGGWRVGAWGAALTLLCPGLVAHSWYFSLDYALIGMMLMGCYLLWRTEGFARPWWCLAFAVWSSLALAVKLSYALYLAAPSLAALVVGLRRPERRLRLLAYLAGAVVLTLTLSLLLNGWDPAQVWTELRIHFSTKVEGAPSKLVEPWTLSWALTNASFAAANFPWPALLLTLPGLVLAHWRRKPLPSRWLLLTLLWATYLLLTLMSNKMERYMQPLYPVLCLLAAWWVTVQLPRRWQTVALLWTATAFGALLWHVHLHPTPWLAKGRADEVWMHEIGMPGQRVLDGLRRNTYHPRCQLGPVLQAMHRLEGAAPGRRPLGVAVHWPAATAGHPAIPMQTHDLYITAAQVYSGRFVVYKDGHNEDEFTPELLAAPSLFVLHPAGLDMHGELPMLTRLGARRIWLRCDKEWIAAEVTLLRPRPGR